MNTRITAHQKNRLPISLLLVAFLSASASAQPTGIYVANQGNFADNSGSVSYHDLTTETTRTVIEDFGTLVQSLTIVDDLLYVMSNTSEAIDVIDTNAGARIAQIAGIGSPRYMAMVEAEKAYVSNLFSATVTIVDLSADSATGTIAVGQNPEDIAVVGGRAYVANSGFGGDSTLTVIDTATDTVIETIDVGCRAPRHLEVDSENELWVFCNGTELYDPDYNVTGTINGAIAILDGTSGESVTSFGLDFVGGAASFGHDSHFAEGPAEVFYIHGSDVLVYNTATNQYQETITLAGEEGIGGVAYDPAAKLFYAGRPAADFISAGVVSVHERDGKEVARISAGIAPTQILLVPEPTATVNEPAGAVPNKYLVLSNYPNPFNPSSTLQVVLPEAGNARLTIYNALGQPVDQLIDGPLPAGMHKVQWDASGYPSGVYMARIRVGEETVTQRMVLAK